MLSSLLSHPRSSQTPHPTKFIHSLSLSKQKTILQEQKKSITQKNPTKKQKETNTLTKKKKEKFCQSLSIAKCFLVKDKTSYQLASISTDNPV